MKNYVRYQDFFKNYLGAWSFEDGDEVLTIVDVKVDMVYDRKIGGNKEALVVQFKERALPMICNKTNADMIAKVCETDKLSEWIGCKVVVGSSKVSVAGNECEAIRVRDTVPDDDLLICEECGNVIRATKSKQPSELAEISKRNTGKVMCVACMKKYKEENDG